MRFNLIEAEWIPVLRTNGTFERVGIRKALIEAGRIRQIAASSPLDSFAAYRFLLTLLYWKAGAAGGLLKVRESLLHGKVPDGVLNAIKREARSFDLLDNDMPFLQDPSVLEKAKKSAGSLFAEFACGTNIAHFHHGADEDMRLCLPCTAIGMLRIIPWSQSGGAGLSPSVHNAPPIVAMAVGETLADTLGFNLVELEGEPGEAVWSGHFTPSDGSDAIPFMEAFTWNPRRVHLRSVESNGVCWRCGCQGVRVVGPIVYAKNENTKSNKKSGKTIPFVWHDPSAFYKSDAPYITIKSYDEERAANGRDLLGLIDQNDSQPSAAVLSGNPEHRGWRLVIPCINPAHNKTYDHRQIELANLSSDALLALVPPAPSLWRQRAINGWTDPHATGPTKGSAALVRSAVRLLTHGDWAVLASSAYRSMHESPAAFDLLAGLLWPLRRKVSGLPSRNVAWLLLKLMGGVPSRARIVRGNASFCPLDVLPKRQLGERRSNRSVPSPYPVSLPRGQRLESALHGAIGRHLRQNSEPRIDWPCLCDRLNQLLD